ncbi:MAG: UDP-N-acetylmuramoyl-L-alanyl-D-glutamate--2,6-diaminopimelate ligase [Oscillospiraceae bacterium]|nr:UDP-N-acetylmuramoyl-L-alanyl-D-glutamate--2,6-diaminopimelate ligase [Oscillospiraceae bacterium]
MKLSALLREVETLCAFEDVEIERVTDKFEDNLNNALFICIDGDRFDGHGMAAKALEKGAAAVVTERDLKLSRQIVVENTRKAYSLIAANFYGRPAEKLQLIGITGTNGKTSTAYFIKSALLSMSVKCGLIGTVENDTGEGGKTSVLTTPEPMELQRLFREMVDSGCKYCVMEVSSQALSQERVYGLHFAAAVLTNITPDHLDYHGSMEEYINAKLSLFDISDTAIVNMDDENSASVLDRIKCPLITCSAKLDSADYTAKNAECGTWGVKYEFVGIDCISRMSLKLLGRFTVYNSLCAAAVCLKLGFELDDISNAFKNIKPVKGRAEIVEVPRDFTVVIDYAHTPDGLQNILNCVRELTTGRIITVFGCGGDRDRTKRSTMGEIAGKFSDIAIITSDNPRTENPILIINDILSGINKSKAKLAVIENRREAIGFALKKARAGDLVLLAGKGHETYQIIGHEKRPFDEREIIKEFVK